MTMTWKGLKKWAAIKLMPFVAKNAPDSVNAFIQERAGEMAIQVTMQYLARQGVLTCGMCPKRAPLIRVGKMYACPEHVEPLRKRLEVKKEPAAVGG